MIDAIKLRSILLATVAVAASCPTTSGADAERVDPSIATVEEIDPYACGPLALTILLRLEGSDVGLDRIDSDLGEPSRQGHSLAELARAADRLGYPLGGIRIAPGDGPIRHPALAHLMRDGQGHFVVVRPLAGSDSLVQVIDPAVGSSITSLDILIANPGWTGVALARDRSRWRRAASLAMIVASGIAYLIGGAARVGQRRRGGSGGVASERISRGLIDDREDPHAFGISGSG